MRFRKLILLLAWLAAVPVLQVAAQTSTTLPATLIAQPGDTWAALSWRFGVERAELQRLNPHMNAARQPAIGRPVTLPAGATERPGRLVRAGGGGLVGMAAANGLPVWAIAQRNGLVSPYRPTFYHPLYLAGDGVVRDLPAGLVSLELSSIPAQAGLALGLRGVVQVGDSPIAGALDGLPIAFATAGEGFAGVVGAGAFYAGGEPELVIRVGENPAWSQPWAFDPREWEYQELTLTGEAAAIDQQARDEERARLREIWTQITPQPLWDTSFQTPIADYLAVTAHYGARRSYNGGPYLTYHEGVDFSAYGGTPVFAPAAGRVVLAEPLHVRGGAVIIDHGLGIYTGYYHLSAVHATVGQQVRPGDLLGEVGTTGLSTGNHLHWDLLINGIWVDAAAWQSQDLACWLLSGLGVECPPTTSTGEPQ